MSPTSPKRLTPHGEKILARLLSAAPSWMTRSQIAERLGKKKLTPYDLGMLELLVKMELIESVQKPGSGRDGFQWEYRAK